MRRLLSWSWLLVPVAALFALGLVACTAGEPPSSTSSAPSSGSLFNPVPGQVLSHDAVEPTSLRLGNIRAKVVPVTLNGTTLTPPADPLEVGWWGRMAGAKHGTTLLVGHTVHTGGGALDRLGDIPVGTVGTVSGIRYRVVSNKPVSKTELTLKAEKLFEQDGKSRLVVVTCTNYNEKTGEYPDNEVLIAVPVS